MTGAEFSQRAARATEELAQLPRHQAVAAACRGSGNPAVLAYLAEAMGLVADQRLLDVGAGLGGPAAWLTDRYDVRVVALDPFAASAGGARRVFGLPAVVGTAAALPLPDACVDAAMSLVVLSTLEDPRPALAEAARVVRRGGTLGALVTCATGSVREHAGGSTFRPPGEIAAAVADAGWVLEVEPTAMELPRPPRWERLQTRLEQRLDRRHGPDGDADMARARDDEAAVVDLLESGRTARYALVARRA